MTDLIYEIVEHDGGWAYKAKGVFSETYSSHAAALAAAQKAVQEQKLPDATETIEYQDRDGRWHEELSPGDDRPETKIIATK